MNQKIITYLRNKIYGYIFKIRLKMYAGKHVENRQKFFKVLKDKSNTLYTIKFDGRYIITARGKDFSGVSESCILKDYTRFRDINPGDVVFDVGSCMGDFSIYAASRGARVFAFEPDADNFSKLMHNVQQNNFENVITTHNFGISSDGRNISFLYDEKNPGGSGAVNVEGGVQIATKTVADIINENKIEKINFFKIDTEGAEYDIFSNPKTACLDKIDYIAGEYHLNSWPEGDLETVSHYLKPFFSKVTSGMPYYFYAER